MNLKSSYITLDTGILKKLFFTTKQLSRQIHFNNCTGYSYTPSKPRLPNYNKTCLITQHCTEIGNLLRTINMVNASFLVLTTVLTVRSIALSVFRFPRESGYILPYASRILQCPCLCNQSSINKTFNTTYCSFKQENCRSRSARFSIHSIRRLSHSASSISVSNQNDKKTFTFV